MKKDRYKIMVMKDKTNKSKIKHDLFDLPCRMCICGKSGTGKTSLLSLLIIDPNNEFYRGRWAPEDIFLFSGSYKTDNKIQKMVEHCCAMLWIRLIFDPLLDPFYHSA